MEAKKLQKAEACDLWGHVIRKPELAEGKEREMITPECALLGNPCPHWLWSRESVIVSPQN